MLEQLRSWWQLFVLVLLASELVWEIVLEVGWRGYWGGRISELVVQVTIGEAQDG